MGRRRKNPFPISDDEDSKHPIQRNCANERERDRMRVLSRAFSKLKTTLPWVPPDTKLSKLDTLRLATCYIAHLRQILADDSDVTDQHNSPQTLTGAPPGDGFENLNCVTSLHDKMTSPLGTRNSNETVQQNGTTESGYVHPLNLTWPFNFSGRYSVNVSLNDVRMMSRSDVTSQESLTVSSLPTKTDNSSV